MKQTNEILMPDFLCGICGHVLVLRESNNDWNELWCQWCHEHRETGRKVSIHKSKKIEIKKEE
jgi:hypothetical protein